MKAWLKALAFSRRAQLITRSFTTNAAVVIPSGISRLDSLVGQGGAGQPGQPGSDGYTVTTTTYLYRKDGGTDETTETYTGSGPPPGSSGCDPFVPDPSSTIYDGYIVCRTYSSAGSPPTPPTTGPSATAFGQTFVGGTGGAATPREVKNVPVTGGASYNIVVPVGGLITVTYYL